jgi:membrane-bound serine protease (ClpP class)
MGPWIRFGVFLGCLGMACGGKALSETPQGASTPEPQILNGILVLPIRDTINPGTSLSIERGIRLATESKRLLIIELNTPGGLLTATRDIVSNILESPVPIVVYVTPSGAQAASAGMMITIAAHHAAMAPGTNIGAAHPVMGTGGDIPEDMKNKVVNDTVSFVRSIAEFKQRNADWIEKGVKESASITAEEALKNKVIDGIYESRQGLVSALANAPLTVKDTTRWKLPPTPESEELTPTFREQLMTVLGHPNIAYALLAAGGLGIYLEMSHPGLIVPGVIGGISLLLGLISMQVLPVRWGSLALFLLGFALLLAEMFVPSFGFLGIGGLVALFIGSIYLFDPTQGLGGVDFGIVLGVVLGIGLIFLIVLVSLNQIRKASKTVGSGQVIGKTGMVVEIRSDKLTGTCRIHGEYWKFKTSEPSLKVGDTVTVTQEEGLRVVVTKTKSDRVET